MKTFSEFLDEALLPSLIKAAARQFVKSKALQKAVPKVGKEVAKTVKLPSKVTGFQTGRGSKYTYNPRQGSWPQTQRTAAKDPYHPTAPGVKQKSDYTMFTTPDASMAMRQNFVSKGAVNPQTKEPFFKGLPQSPTPRRGRAPVEVWNKYAEKGGKQAIHPGSPITDIQTTTRGSNVGLYGAQRREIRDRVKAGLQKPANIEDIKRQLGIKPKNSSIRKESVKQQKTFSEFLELAEKYYAPDDKLPSGKSPLRKALKKQEKRESEIGPNSNITRMRKHSEKIETKVKHGSDNPNYNSRVNSRDDDEVRVDSDGTDYMTVHHKPSKVTYNVVKSPGPGNVHSIEWSHERGHREGLLPSERNSISRDARRVYDRHVSHRLPHGATLHNKPAKEGLGKIYKRAGFGNVDSDNDQFARIGREKSPKQKEKGKKGRLTPLDPKKTKRDANWDGDSRGSGGDGNDSYRLDRIANLAFGG